MSILIIIFILCVWAVFHTYVFYPWYLDQRNAEFQVPRQLTEFPSVDIVIAAFNEDRVIEDKLASIVGSNYPLHKIRVLIGSDGSDDRTEEIVKGFKSEDLAIELFSYERSGKTATVNKLLKEAKGEIAVLTDANVIFTLNTLSTLVSYFQDEKVGLIGANIKAEKITQEGISAQESEYLERENRMKWKEGTLWGTMMGAFGGCYAIRTSLYKPVPEHFLVDDFHITMSVLDQGYDAVLAKEAICYEDISSKLSEEFRRKVRMSTGNFQNLRAFSRMLFHKRKGLSFSFISHKVLRWLTPLFILTSLICSFLLKEHHPIWNIIFYAHITLICIPLMEITLDSLKIKSRFIRFITYFVSMNAALLIGMVKSMKRVEKAIWKPTERNL